MHIIIHARCGNQLRLTRSACLNKAIYLSTGGRYEFDAKDFDQKARRKAWWNGELL